MRQRRGQLAEVAGVQARELYVLQRNHVPGIEREWDRPTEHTFEVFCNSDVTAY